MSVEVVSLFVSLVTGIITSLITWLVSMHKNKVDMATVQENAKNKMTELHETARANLDTSISKYIDKLTKDIEKMEQRMQQEEIVCVQYRLQCTALEGKLETQRVQINFIEEQLKQYTSKLAPV